MSVQSRLKRPELPKRAYNDEAYLKSTIYCPDCYRPMTCGKSKGRSKYYWYYECTAHRVSYRLDKAHSIFDQILDEITFTDDQLLYVEKSVKQMLNKHFKETEVQLPVLTAKRAELILKKEGLEDKYLSGKLDDETFANWSVKLKSELKEIENKINSSSRSKDEYWSRFAGQMENLKSIKPLFHMANTVQKSIFVEKGFGTSLVYDGRVYRTAFLNPLFQHKALVLRCKELLEVHKKTEILNESPSWVPHTSLTEPFIELFDWFDLVKTA